jgi:nucleotide-binding universal stress UspA family protein
MKILVAYDGSSCADAAIADLRNAGLPKENEVLVISVGHDGWPASKHSTEELGQFGSPWKAVMADTGECAAQAAARIQAEFPASTVTSEALWGSPANTIKKTVDHWQPDLLVVGSHGRTAVGRALLGSVSLDLVHHAHCSVRVVRPGVEPHAGPLRIVVGVDGSPHSDAALRAITHRAWPPGTRVRAVSTLQALVPPVPALVPALEGNTLATEQAFRIIDENDQRESARLHKVADDAGLLLEAAGLDASSVVIEGDPRTELAAEAERWHANTIFVGARGLGAVDRFLLGSVSSAIVTHAHCAVEVVRH